MTETLARYDPLCHAYERQGSGHKHPELCWWCGQARAAHRTERALVTWGVWEIRPVEGQDVDALAQAYDEARVRNTVGGTFSSTMQYDHAHRAGLLAVAALVRDQERAAAAAEAHPTVAHGEWEFRTVTHDIRRNSEETRALIHAGWCLLASTRLGRPFEDDTMTDVFMRRRADESALAKSAAAAEAVALRKDAADARHHLGILVGHLATTEGLSPVLAERVMDAMDFLKRPAAVAAMKGVYRQ